MNKWTGEVVDPPMYSPRSVSSPPPSYWCSAGTAHSARSQAGGRRSPASRQSTRRPASAKGSSAVAARSHAHEGRGCRRQARPASSSPGHTGCTTDRPAWWKPHVVSGRICGLWREGHAPPRCGGQAGTAGTRSARSCSCSPPHRACTRPGPAPRPRCPACSGSTARTSWAKRSRRGTAGVCRWRSTSRRGSRGRRWAPPICPPTARSRRRQVSR